MIRRLISWAFLLFVFAQFDVWVSASEAAAGPKPRSKAAAEPQSRQQGARLARLYFLRERGLWATEAGIKKSVAEKVLNSFMNTIEKALKKGDKITLTGRKVKSGAPYMNLTDRANVVLTDSGKEIFRTNNYGTNVPKRAGFQQQAPAAPPTN